jgi:hypothetical protein
MFLNRLCKSFMFSVILFVFASAQTELVKNGNFSSGSTNWTLNKYGGSSSGSVVNGEYTIIVTTAGTEHWHVQFIQTGISLVQGKSYTYSFDAYKGNQNSGAQSMQLNIGQSASPWTSYWGSQNQMVTLTTTKTRYTYQITMTQPSDANARLEFNCGKSTGGFYIDNVSLIENSNPLLSATPLSIDFGTVLVGTPKTVNVLLQNNGGVSTTVSSLASSSGNFTIGLSAPVTVPASGAATVPVTFTTGMSGSYSGTLVILSNATNNPTITVTLSGRSENPGIGISPTTLGFSTTPNLPSSKTIDLSNTGSSAITWSMASGNAWVSAVPGSGTIPAGGQMTCVVTANAASVGTYTGNLSLTHSATNQPSPFTLPVTLSVLAGYQPTCPLIVEPDQARSHCVPDETARQYQRRILHRNRPPGQLDRRQRKGAVRTIAYRLRIRSRLYGNRR